MFFICMTKSLRLVACHQSIKMIWDGEFSTKHPSTITYELNILVEPHYNTHFGVHSDISVITGQPYNEVLMHRKYEQWEPCV